MAMEPGKKLNIAQSVEYSKGCVVSRQLIGAPRGTITAFAFDADQGLSEHSTPHTAFLQVTEGVAIVIIRDSENEVSAGECILLPANVPHQVRARKGAFKMILTMIWKGD